jgi:4a-hydroxytetrahydrobiopterin dehydratase
MTDEVTPARFHEVGWRVLAYAACTHYRTGSLAEGARLAEAIGRVAQISGRSAHVDLRPTGVTVRLPVDENGHLTEDDADLADEITASAAELGVTTDLNGLQMTQVAIDALSIPDVMPFWKAVLSYETFGDTLVDPRHEGPTVWFQQMDAPRPQRNRIHVDVYLPQDQAEARIEAALAAGGRVVYEGHAPHWWTLADAEGNEADVAPWPDREEDR